MRLFIAILLKPEIRAALFALAQQIEKQSWRGHFTQPENYHLTLVFIGETDQTQAIKTAMDAVTVAPFTMQVGGLGKFPRREGDVFWAGVKPSGPLLSLYEQLVQGLSSQGISLEQRPYRPHLTLGRGIRMPEEFSRQGAWQNWLVPMTQEVGQISLMQSARVAGELKYIELYARPLG